MFLKVVVAELLDLLAIKPMRRTLRQLGLRVEVLHEEPAGRPRAVLDQPLHPGLEGALGSGDGLGRVSLLLEPRHVLVIPGAPVVDAALLLRPGHPVVYLSMLFE